MPGLRPSAVVFPDQSGELLTITITNNYDYDYDYGVVKRKKLGKFSEHKKKIFNQQQINSL